jgi:hypothetical protein
VEGLDLPAREAGAFEVGAGAGVAFDAGFVAFEAGLEEAGV